MIELHLVHCVGGCKRGAFIDLQGKKLSEVSCLNCGSKNIAVWQESRCLYDYTGKVQYPFGSKMKVGDTVKGPV